MFEWMNRHKKNIMKYTMWLVIPSFIVFYGYGQCAQPEIVRWVARVNDEEISEATWRSIAENLRNQARNQPNQTEEPSYDEMLDQALEYAIVGSLIQQKAGEWGIHTTDEEIRRAIREIPAFQNESGNFDYQRYISLLYSNNLSETRFEEDQRSSLTRAKVQAVVSQSLNRATSEKQRMEGLENTTASIEYLAFEPANYIEQVTADEEGLAKFFAENQEDFRVPEQRRIAFARFVPSNYISEVTYTERELTRYFDRNRQTYEVPEKTRLQYVLYAAKDLAAQVQVTDEEIAKQYNDNASSYMKPEQARVRYAQIPLATLAQQQAVTDEEIAQYYTADESRFEHGDIAKARHILLRVPPNSTPEQEQAVKDRVLQIRDEIAQGLPFAEAAKKYSEDTVSGGRGGDLGYFDKGQMVPAFDEAAFSLPLAQVSEPVKSDFGFHLLLVEDRKPAGKDTLEAARPQILEMLQKQKAIQALRDQAQSLNSLETLAGTYTLQTTDWFSRSNSEIPGIPRNEGFVFQAAVFNDTSNPVVMAGNTAVDNLYLIEVLEKQPARSQTPEEAREKVVADLQQAKASQVAQQAAEADLAEIKSASMELQTLAERRGLAVNVTEPFSQADPMVPGMGVRTAAVSQITSTLKEGETGGPVQGPQGTYLVRLVAKEPARLPEMAEVQDQVRGDFIQESTVRLARTAANVMSIDVFSNQIGLMDAAVAKNIESGSTALFKANEPIPDLGMLNNLNQAAFKLEKVGDISDPVEETGQPAFGAPNQEQPVEAIYLAQLQEIKESYLPPLDEVRTEAERAYRLKLAEPVAVEKAQQVLQQIQAKIAGAQPISATKTVDLSAFADKAAGAEPTGTGAAYRGPVDVTGLGQVPSLGRALSLAKTALALQPGQVSSVVTNYRMELNKDSVPEQGPMTGAYILQVLDKKVPKPDEPAPSSQLAQFMEQAMQRMAVSAWIEEVSASAVIEYNENLLSKGDVQDATAAEQMTDTKSKAKG